MGCEEGVLKGWSLGPGWTRRGCWTERKGRSQGIQSVFEFKVDAAGGRKKAKQETPR